MGVLGLEIVHSGDWTMHVELPRRPSCVEEVAEVEIGLPEKFAIE
jgi:hypothetical protein